MLRNFSKYLEVDRQKRLLVDEVLYQQSSEKLYLKELDISYSECCDVYLPLTKYCPKCHRKYPDDENFCYKCAVKLKNIDDIVKIRDIKTSPKFDFDGKIAFKSFEDIFTQENITKINDFDFKKRDYNKIIKDIKIEAFRNYDDLVSSNELVQDWLSVLDQVLLFAKSFTQIKYKSYGEELGFYSFNVIEIDDRQRNSLQITTLIHELSHFLLGEILARVLCIILDCSKNEYIEALITFILSYSPFTRLIDEYSAHTVEGRFTVYGYQDYSSFLQIEKTLDGEMSRDEIEITKSIGNTFANSIKDILESYIDVDLREDIKELFLEENFDSPNYEMLKLENCEKLTDEGFLKAIWLILNDGVDVARLNVSKLEEYEECF